MFLPHRAACSCQRGFTLLEAIVALALISSVGMALFSWINSSISTLGRVEESIQRATATRNTLQFMQTVNPMETPSGEETLGEYRIRWNAEPITERVDGASFPYGISLYQFTLYNTRIEVLGAPRRPDFTVEVKQVGYRRVRAMVFAPQ
ncbi:MAG: type II secretion system protein [Anderseniella sp.]|jgi:general secretion pathway protein I|nr:type II secretion system protein [Anderseniella sp.]